LEAFEGLKRYEPATAERRVMKTDGMLRHLAFFEELGSMDESDASWRAVSAGLVVMRLVDRWMSDGARGLTAHSVSAVRAAIEEMAETTPVRRILSSVVDAMEESESGEMHAVMPRLMAYGQGLEYESKLSLAADVYRTIVAHAHPIEDADIAIPAHHRLGFCLRNMGDLTGAAAAYDDASRLSSSAGDLVSLIRAQVGRANVWISLGNVPQAEALLDDAIVRAGVPGFEEIRSRALHDRAHVAALRGQYERTIQFAYEALDIAGSQRERDRILCDIAAGFSDLGLLHIARDAYLVIASTAQEQYVRWLSELNLLELAAREGCEPQFDRYRRSLESEDLTPQLRVLYLLHVGRGYDYLGQTASGIAYLERAVRLAEQFKVNQLLFDAEAALDAARRRCTPSHKEATRDIPQSVRDVAEVIENMRRLAEVG
jgi:tetratricopeptide (TPR) repeat protein